MQPDTANILEFLGWLFSCSSVYFSSFWLCFLVFVVIIVCYYVASYSVTCAVVSLLIKEKLY